MVRGWLDLTRAIGQGKHLGSLEPGKQADLFGYDPGCARSVPVLDPIASLVHSAGTEGAVTTVLAGQIVLKAGEITTVDEEALLRECQEAAVVLDQRADTLPNR